MNVFTILSILVIVIGVILLVVSPSVLLTKKLHHVKTLKDRILVILFYSSIFYIIMIIFWIFK